MEVTPKNKARLCPICMTTVDASTAVGCPSCGQLYHPHCWTYNNNQCGVLGCDGRMPIRNERQGTRWSRVIPILIAFMITIIVAMGGLVGAYWLVSKASSLAVRLPPTANPRTDVTSTTHPVQVINTVSSKITSTNEQFAVTPVASPNPSSRNLVSPEQFIRDYFSAINNREYERAWSMLSPNFHANQNYDEYTSWWRTVEKVDVVSIDIRSQSESEVYIYVEANYLYKNGSKATGHTTYKLIKDETGYSWLFEPN